MTKRLRILLGALVALLGVAGLRNLLLPKSGPGLAAAKLAQQSAMRGELPTAIQHWRQAVIAEPGNGDYHGELGNAYLSAHDYDLAVAELQAAAYLHPQRPHVYCQLAQALVEEHRRSEALEALAVALKSTPDCPLALSVKGEQALRDDNLKEALPAFQRVIQLQPDFALAYQKVGYLLLSLNRPEEALQVLEKGLTISSGNPGFHALLGEAYARKPSDPRAIERAQQHYQAALTNNPEAAKAHAALGKLYLRSNDLDAARKAYGNALALQPYLGDALYGMSQVARRQGRSAEAAGYLKVLDAGHTMERTIRDLQARALADSTNVDLRVRIAKECLHYGLTDEAGRALEEAVTLDPSRRDVREIRAQWYRTTGLGERAIAEAAVASQLPRVP